MADDRWAGRLRECRIIMALQVFIGVLSGAVCILNLAVGLWGEAVVRAAVATVTAVIHFGITRPRYRRLKLGVRELHAAEQEAAVRHG